MRGATQYSPPPPSTVTISIHAPHAGRDLLVCTGQFGIAISIHAPHAGRDRGRGRQGHADEDFNPRAPCGARPLPLPNPLRPQPFQSTRPMRGATGGSAFSYLIGQISIHAPHAGRDSKSEQIALHIFVKKAWIPDIFAQNAAFQSVLPLADRQKLLYLRCEPLRKFLRAFASHYKIIGSSGR